MVCKSPLRIHCSKLDIGNGYLYRRKGTVVKKNDSIGVSCRSSVYTLQITQSEISHWRQGQCRGGEEEELCDGKMSEEKCYTWNLPIALFRSADDEGEVCEFDPRWNPTSCDRTHCVIALRFRGEEVTDFSRLPENVRISLDQHLKKISKIVR
jgi:hypothetical protein